MSRKRASPEADLQKMCVQWLKLQNPRAVIFHVPNEIAWNKGTKHYITKGVADIHILWRPEPHGFDPLPHGRYGAVEFKAPGQLQRTSDVQDAWLEAVQKLGHHVAVCDDFERFQDLMRKWGVV